MTTIAFSHRPRPIDPGRYTLRKSDMMALFTPAEAVTLGPAYGNMDPLMALWLSQSKSDWSTFSLIFAMDPDGFTQWMIEAVAGPECESKWKIWPITQP